MATIKTWKMKDGDLVYSAGSFVWIYDNDAVIQRLENRLKLWKDEVRNLRVKTLAEQGTVVPGTQGGIDYLTIFNDSPSEEEIQDIFKEQLLLDEFVTSVDSIVATVNRLNRTLGIAFSVTSAIDNTSISGSI